jgi:hypothetical protein
MVDVVVDQKPMPQKPVDPNTKMPDAVKRRAAAVDALYQQPQQPTPPDASVARNESPAAPQATAQVPSPPGDPPPPAVSSAPPTAEPQAPPEPPPAEPPPGAEPPDDGAPGSWKHRYLAREGRHAKELAEIEDQMAQMGQELVRLQRMVQQPQNAPPPAFLTEDDLRNFGPEMLDLAQRAARQVVVPEMQRLQSENEQLRENMARASKRTLDQALDYAVPNWREVNRNPRFISWLRLPDVYSSAIRKELLDEATAAVDAPRVISFFRGFLKEEEATGHSNPEPRTAQPAMPPREPAVPLASLAAPGRARPANGGDPSLPPERPIYTRADLARIGRDWRQGVYRGREAEYQRLWEDIVAAGREGRVQG